MQTTECVSMSAQELDRLTVIERVLEKRRCVTKERTEEILYADINLNDVKNSHAQKLFLRDRKPELYCDWLGK